MSKRKEKTKTTGAIAKELREQVSTTWMLIGDFEEHEQHNDSKNPILAKARQDARMEAYVRLVERLI